MVPYFKQERSWTCGPAVMRMVLSSLGVNKTEDQVTRLLGTNKMRGTWNRSFPMLAEKLKLDYIVKRNAELDHVRWARRHGYQVIVCYYVPSEEFHHYAVVDMITKEKITLLDPFFGKITLSIQKFSRGWENHSRWDKEKKWFIGVKQ